MRLCTRVGFNGLCIVIGEPTHPLSIDCLSWALYVPTDMLIFHQLFLLVGVIITPIHLVIEARRGNRLARWVLGAFMVIAVTGALTISRNLH